jgi:hypothetical protein
LVAFAACVIAPSSARAQVYEPSVEVRAEIEREVDAISADVAAVRGRPWKRKVRVAFAKPASPEARVSGFYAWGSDTITLVDTRALVRRPLIAHELTHALQDQYVDLRALERGKSGDQEMAISAAIEGEAHAVAIGVILRQAGLDALLPPERWPPARLLAVKGYELSHRFRWKPGPEAKELPPVERDPFLAPYVEGLAFVQAVMKARGTGLRALDAVLVTPPVSMAEVMHPEKWLRRCVEGGKVEPLEKHAAATGGGLILESIGEWRIRALLLEALPRTEARRAAAGWVADCRQESRAAETGERTVIWTSDWESPEDAREFADAYRKYCSFNDMKSVGVHLVSDRSVTVTTRKRPASSPPRAF